MHQILEKLKKIYKNPKFQNKRIRKQSKDLKEINPNSLEAIKILRIPKNNSEDYDLIEIDSLLENVKIKDLQTVKDIQNIINFTIKEIQNIGKFFARKDELIENGLLINKLYAQKDTFIENGLIYENVGNHFASFTNYYFALEIANKLNQKEEAEILNEAVDRMIGKLNKKKIERFYKKYLKNA